MDLFFLIFGLEEMRRAEMIIPSTLIRLDYNPAKDVLSVEWPDVQFYALDKVRHILKEVIDTVRYYDVKRLLIDARNSITGIDYEDYVALATDFGIQLTLTRLEKVARIESTSNQREKHVQHISEKNSFHAAVAFKNFPDEVTAITWLETGY